MQKPGASYTPRIYKNHQTIFGGINHTAACGEGEIYDMKNIGNGDYPVLTPRPVRFAYEPQEYSNGRYFHTNINDLDEKIYITPERYYVRRYDKTYVIEKSYKLTAADGTGSVQPTVDKTAALYECPEYTEENRGEYLAYPINDVFVLTDVCVPEDKILVINKYIFTSKSHCAIRRDVKGRFQSEEKLKAAVTAGEISPRVGDVYAVPAFQQNGVSGPTLLLSYARTSYYAWNGTSFEWDEYKYRIYASNCKVEQAATIPTAEFKNGTYQGESAEANTIVLKGYSGTMPFSVGDGVIISGCVNAKANNKAAIIREKGSDSSGNTELRFYENVFDLNGGTSVTETNITISLKCPDMEYMCECGNRLFGCVDDTIYACKLGDPFNWNVFDGLSTDSYSVDVASAGEFTGCADYNGYVLFFKPDRIYKLYNIEDTPKNWRLTELETYGLKAGCEDTLAQADNYLFWLSPRGVVRYSGSYPEIISEPLALAPDDTGIGGTDGQNYYISIKHTDGTSTLYMFDTQHGIWFKHDDIDVRCFTQDEYGALVIEGNYQGDQAKDHVTRLHGVALPEDTGENASDRDTMESFVEFGDIMNNTTEHKYISQLGVTAEVLDKGRLDFYLSTDSGATWQEMGSIGPSPKATTILPITPVRCDFFRIKIIGKGQWKIYAIARGYMSGTDR